MGSGSSSAGESAWLPPKLDANHPFNKGEAAQSEKTMPSPADNTMKVLYWMHRMHTEVLSESEAQSWDNMSVQVFDQRWDGNTERSLLAVCIPASATLFIFAVEKAEKLKAVIVRQHAKLSARSILAVRSIRPGSSDLLVVKPDHTLCILTYGLREIPLRLIPFQTADIGMAVDGAEHPHHHGRLVAVTQAAGESFTAVFDSGACFRASLFFIPQDNTTNVCLAALSMTLPLDDFFRLHVGMLMHWSHIGFSVATGVQQLDSLAASLADLLQLPSRAFLEGRSRDAVPEEPWQQMSQSRSRAKFEDDPAFARLVIPGRPLHERPATPSTPHPLVAPVLNTLHLVGEDCRLTITGQHALMRLAPIICELALLVRPEWADYWKRFCPEALAEWPSSSAAVVSSMDDRLPIWPIDTTAVLFGRISNPGWTLALHTRNLGSHFGLQPSFAYGRSEPLRALWHLTTLYMCLADEKVPETEKRAHNVVKEMARLKMSAHTFDVTPIGLSAPLREAMRTCQAIPPASWPTSAYRMVERNDLAEAYGPVSEPPRDNGYTSIRDFSKAPAKRLTVNDIIKKAQAAGSGEVASVSGVELDLEGFTDIRFGQDRRLEEVARILCSSTIPIIKGFERPDATEHDIARDQQHQVVRIAERTLALPYGRAMFTFGAASALTRESFVIPKMEFQIRLHPQNLVIGPEVNKIPKESIDWGEFHNGVAAGLRIAPGASAVESSWIAFNKPSELTPEHAGFLFALGLTGHLKEMLTWQTFSYLTPKHELTSIGILLGLSAANAGTGHEHVTKLLAVHAPALLPDPAVDLNVPLVTQTAALTGIGLVYMGTSKRHMAEVLLNEMQKRDSSQPDLTNEHREAYTLAAGFGFGMVMLGKGSEIPADRELVNRLRALIHGPSSFVKPGTNAPAFDVNLTSPAATVALGLMYLRTERRDVADVITIPDAVVELHRIQPSFLLMRTVARSLIMWEPIAPNNTWLIAQIPQLLRAAIDARNQGKFIDDALELAYFNIIAGACFAVALKFAGTADEGAYSMIVVYHDLYSKLAYTNGSAFDARIKRSSIRECLNLVSISLNMVMAGTGEISTLRRLRFAFGQYNQPIRYGTHLSNHMSMGLLFLGGGRYTLGRSDAAIACMVAAFYPRFAQVSSDNKCYLQALRHLWVLAVEPRCLIARDVDTREVVYLPLRIRVHERNTATDQLRNIDRTLIAPTLIPDLDAVQWIKVESPRYWPILLHIGGDPRHKHGLVRSQTIFVKRRSAFLSYMEDPKGSRSLLVRSGGSTADAATLDNPQLADAGAQQTGDLDKFITSFSNDPFFLAAADHLCRGAGATAAERAFVAYCHAALLDSLLQDKPRALQTHLTLYRCRTMSPRSKYFNLRTHDLRFMAEFYEKTFPTRFSGRAENNARAPLIRETTINGVLHALDGMLEPTRTTREFLRTLGRYARGHAVQPPTEDVSRTLAWYLLRNSVPVSTLLAVLKGLAEQAHRQCIGAAPPQGTADAEKLDQGIKEVLHITGMQMTSILGSGWSMRSLDEIVHAWSIRG